MTLAVLTEVLRRREIGDPVSKISVDFKPQKSTVRGWLKFAQQHSLTFKKIADMTLKQFKEIRHPRECLDFCVQSGFQGGSQSRLPFVYRGLKINDQRLRETLSRRHKCAKRGECGAPSGGFHHTLHHSIAWVKTT